MADPRIGWMTEPVIAAAKHVAEQAHRGQKDKSGEPYIGHPARVAIRLAENGEEPNVVAAGWLHDVVEDTPVTLDDLREMGFPEDVVEMVDALTRRDRERPAAYYARVRGNAGALRVKARDIDDNTAPWRTVKLEPDTQARLARKYTRARVTLGLAG